MPIPTPRLAQLLADYNSISLQIKALNSKADNYTFLFNSTRSELNRTWYQTQAILYISESHTLQARLEELETLILSHNFSENETHTHSKEN